MQALGRAMQKVSGEKNVSYETEFIAAVAEMEKMERLTREVFEAGVKFIEAGTKRPGKASTRDFEYLIKRQPDRISFYQDLGHAVKQLGEEVNNKKQVKVGIAMKLVGQGENTFVSILLNNYLQTIDTFLHKHFDDFKTQHKQLENLRLDYDAAITKARKAEEAAEKNPSKASDAQKLKNDEVIKKDAFIQKKDQLFKFIKDCLKSISHQDSLMMQIIDEMIKFHSDALENLKQTKSSLGS